MKIVRRSIRGNRESHKSKGLTYVYMRNFIKVMDSSNRVTFEDTVDYFQDMYNGNSSKTYVAVRDWFLENYSRHAEMIVETAPKAACCLIKRRQQEIVKRGRAVFRK